MSSAPRRAAFGRAAALAACVITASAACVELPVVGGGECGNGVIEPPEDCDGFDAESGASCLPKGAVGECHLSCSRAEDGQDRCPEGWGCALSGICRRPTGSFEPPRELDVGTAHSLVSADFDGDGHADVISTERSSPFGVTRLKVHYFDDQGAVSETRQFSHLLIGPSLTDMNGDGRRDLVFTDNSVGVLLGRSDRSMVPETFSSYRIPGTAIRTSSVIDQSVQQTPGFVVLAELDGVAGLYVPDIENGGTPRQLASLSHGVEALVGDPVAGDVVEGSASPCREVVTAARGESQLVLFDVCARDPQGEIVWRFGEAAAQIVALDPAEPIAFAPQIVDMNADGHLDVLIGSAERAFVAYGDGSALATAVPLSLTVASRPEPVTPLPMPLAVGDVTGDGVVDFVFPEGFGLSFPSPTLPGQTDYLELEFGGQGPFTAATIADLNANGFPDIVATSSLYPGFSFFNGTGTRDITFFAIPTSRPAERLAVGDFDGDLVQDLAFTQRDPDGAAEQVSIAFGAAFAPPSAPLAVARLGSIDQIVSHTEGKVGNLVISSSLGSDSGLEGALTLLVGSGDRVPVASYELTTFAVDSSVNGALAARVVGGAFLGTSPGDVLALAFPDEINVPLVNDALELWLLPQLMGPKSTPQRLATRLPPELRPVLGAAVGISLAVVAVDLDADGRDEAVLAAPARDDDHCGLYTLRIEADRAELLGASVLAEPCASLELSALQVDADGLVDVAWLTARADGSERRLSIFWNDGSGALSSERRSVVSEPAESPLAFAVLPPNAVRGPSLVLATPSGIELRGVGAARELGTPERVLEATGVTGLTAGDWNGDGVVDLAAAVRGNLTILGALLESL